MAVHRVRVERDVLHKRMEHACRGQPQRSNMIHQLLVHDGHMYCQLHGVGAPN